MQRPPQAKGESDEAFLEREQENLKEIQLRRERLLRTRERIEKRFSPTYRGDA